MPEEINPENMNLEQEEEEQMFPGMDDMEIEGTVATAIQDAIDYIDNEVAQDSADALSYYRQDGFGNEMEGRSQIVSADLRDAVLSMMPSLMRVFFGSERVVEFVAKGPEDEENARQATDYINWIIREQNDGFHELYSVIKSCLIKRSSVLKYWWDETEEVTTHKYSGIDDEQLSVLLNDPDVEEETLETKQEEGEQPYHYLTLKRRTIKGEVKIKALPGEEFYIDRRATGVDDYYIIGHRKFVSKSDMVAMGFDREEVDELSTGDGDFDMNVEFVARNEHNVGLYSPEYLDEQNRNILLFESYMKLDLDDDGICELYKIVSAGSAHKLLSVEACDYVPFCIFTMDPEPNTWTGLSLYDYVHDIQRVKSSIMRQMMDNLALTNNPMMTVQEGMVKQEDLQNTEIGSVIRVRQQGAVAPLAVPFVADHGYKMLDYLDKVKTSRTGQSESSMGLDPDALQSTTKAGVQAVVQGAQQRMDLCSRILAEGPIKKLMTGILKLITRYQDKPAVIRLRNNWTQVDPREWQQNMDVSVNVGLGLGNTDERMQFLNLIASKQEQIMQTMGPESPLLNMQHYRNTLTKMIELAGFRDPNQFVQDPNTYQPPPPQEPPPPDPVVMAQMQALQAQAQTEAARVQLESEKILREDDRKRDEMEAELAIKIAELEAKYDTTIDQQNIRAMMERDRESIRQEANLQRQQMQAEQQMQMANMQQQQAPPQQPLPGPLQ